jgi:hypothetical protein
VPSRSKPTIEKGIGEIGAIDGGDAAPVWNWQDFRGSDG